MLGLQSFTGCGFCKKEIGELFYLYNYTGVGNRLVVSIASTIEGPDKTNSPNSHAEFRVRDLVQREGFACVS